MNTDPAPDTSPLAAVRERLAELRKNAVLTRIECKSDAFRSARLEVADQLEWAANALEAVLEAAPCEAMVGPFHDAECRYVATAHGAYKHKYAFPAWLEAAIADAGRGTP